jgi:hypothetical protein
MRESQRIQNRLTSATRWWCRYSVAPWIKGSLECWARLISENAELMEGSSSWIRGPLRWDCYWVIHSRPPCTGRLDQTRISLAPSPVRSSRLFFCCSAFPACWETVGEDLDALNHTVSPFLAVNKFGESLWWHVMSPNMSDQWLHHHVITPSLTLAVRSITTEMAGATRTP